jgi:hypothetical protein
MWHKQTPHSGFQIRRELAEHAEAIARVVVCEEAT